MPIFWLSRQVLLFSLLAHGFSCNSRAGKGVGKDVDPLTHLNSFDIVLIFGSSDGDSPSTAYKALAKELAKLGNVTVSSTSHPIVSMIESPPSHSLGIFSIGKYRDGVEISLEILAHVELIENGSQILSPVWKAHDSGSDVDLSVEKIVGRFRDAYFRVNTGGERPSFYVREYTPSSEQAFEFVEEAVFDEGDGAGEAAHEVLGAGGPMAL